ncbi:MAG: hypothetical protein Q8O56_03345 [Solirubrobacteraceae bacterium]|nr:hypothetical protein [Solirubrobacteraceae bacterium]
MSDADPNAPQNARRGWKVDEDWASLVVGLALLLLILAEVIVNAWVP